MSSVPYINKVLEKFIKEMNIRPDKGVKLKNYLIGLVTYPDNLVLVKDSPNALNTLFNRLQEMVSKVGL